MPAAGRTADAREGECEFAVDRRQPHAERTADDDSIREPRVRSCRATRQRGGERRTNGRNARYFVAAATCRQGDDCEGRRGAYGAERKQVVEHSVGMTVGGDVCAGHSRRDRRVKLEIREYAGEPRFSPMYHTRSIIS